MKGWMIALVFFTLGLLVANIVPNYVESRMALSGNKIQSSQHIPFNSIKVFEDEIRIQQPGIKYAKVASNSMAPLLTDKSVVFEKPPILEEILPGDIISFYEPSNDAIVLHMVTRILEVNGQTFFRTKGLANFSEDPWLVPFENVKGVMVGTFR